MEAGLAVTSAREIFNRARRLAPLVVLMASLAVPAAARAGGPQPLLPDLMQEVPQDIRIQQNPDAPGDWQLGFTSVVGNVGAGPLEIHGVGPGNADMTAYQVIHMSGGGTTEDQTKPIGVVHYEDESTEEVEIAYGKDVVDWWVLPGQKDPTRSKVGWEGENELTKQKPGTKRWLFAM